MGSRRCPSGSPSRRRAAGYLAGTALATRIVIRVGLDRTIGIGALALPIGGIGAIAAIPLGGASAVPLVAAMAIYRRRMGSGAAANHRGRHDAVPASRRHRVVAGRRFADGLRGGERRDRRALPGASAWPVAIPLAISGCLTFAIWALSREVRARQAALS